MRKTLPVFYLTAATFIFCAQVNAQKLYTSGRHVADYSRHISPSQSPVEQAVYKTFAQRQQVIVIDFRGTELKNATGVFASSLKSKVKQGDLFSVSNTAVMRSLVSQYPEALTMIIPFNGKTITVDLIKSNIFANGFSVVSNENAVKENLDLGAYYKGVIRGEKSLVSISFFTTHVEGLISPAGKAAIELGQMRIKGNESVHAIYSDDNLLSKQNFVCSTADATPDYISQMKNMQRVSLHDPSTANKCVTEYWETSYNIFQQFGSKNAVNHFVTALFNSFSIVYENENIGMKLKTVHIWTKADPYNNSLYTFSSGRDSFDANLALLLSTTGGGGVAWVNTVCRTDYYYNHAFCGSVTDAGSSLPTFSWPVEVTTHEVGHNLGSPHTHACAWNGNNTAIDGCGPTAGYNEGCTAPLPIHGSIMSYCHLVGGVGIDLALGFGEQPGDLIRGVVASCITARCDAKDTGCTAPANITATNITSTSAKIVWNAVPKSAYYYVYSRRNDTTWTLVADNLTSKSFALKKLKPNKKYFVEVGVACNNGQSLSAQINFTTLPSFADENAITANNTQIKVLPNPAREGRFVLQLPNGMENAKVEITNTTGKVVATNVDKGLSRSFNIGSENKGMYFAKVINGNKINAIKIIVQ